jgi:hypothetical protein
MEWQGHPPPSRRRVIKKKKKIQTSVETTTPLPVLSRVWGRPAIIDLLEISECIALNEDVSTYMYRGTSRNTHFQRTTISFQA